MPPGSSASACSPPAAGRRAPRLSGPDGLWLDLGGVAHLFGGERADVRAHPRLPEARSASPPASPSPARPGAAHALARFGGAPLLLCPSGREAEALAPMPLAALRLDEEVLGRAAPARPRADRRAHRHAPRPAPAPLRAGPAHPSRPGARPRGRAVRSDRARSAARGAAALHGADRQRRGDRGGGRGSGAPARPDPRRSGARRPPPAARLRPGRQ